MRIWDYAIRVVGTSFRFKDNSALISDEVWVERVPNNPHDKNAIGVWNIDGSRVLFLGWLPKEIAANIGDDVLPKKGEITWKAPIGLGIKITI